MLLHTLLLLLIKTEETFGTLSLYSIELKELDTRHYKKDDGNCVFTAALLECLTLFFICRH